MSQFTREKKEETKLKIFKLLKKKIDEKTVKYAQQNIDEMAKIINRPREGEIVKLENIEIPYYFVPPKESKMCIREQYYERNGYFRSTIILNRNNLLLDGYTTYLLALNKGYDYITILREK